MARDHSMPRTAVLEFRAMGTGFDTVQHCTLSYHAIYVAYGILPFRLTTITTSQLLRGEPESKILEPAITAELTILLCLEIILV
jgi:hypothetical protein